MILSEWVIITKQLLIFQGDHPHDGGSKYLWNVNQFLWDCTVQHPSRQVIRSSIYIGTHAHLQEISNKVVGSFRIRARHLIQGALLASDKQGIDLSNVILLPTTGTINIISMFDITKSTLPMLQTWCLARQCYKEEDIWVTNSGLFYSEHLWYV
jgi:hypothetical protein